MHIHIWKYRDNPRNYPGYHLSADQDGCVALIKAIRAGNVYAEIKLHPVTKAALSIPNHGASSSSFTSLRLLVKADARPVHFVTSEDSGRLNLECSQHQAECLVNGVQQIMEGNGDYCIGGGGQNVLWFWWYPREGQLT